MWRFTVAAVIPNRSMLFLRQCPFQKIWLTFDDRADWFTQTVREQRGISSKLTNKSVGPETTSAGPAKVQAGAGGRTGTDSKSARITNLMLSGISAKELS